MRSGAAGSTRIASSPAMRISCLRRRTYADVGSERGRGAAGMSVELAAVAGREHAVAVQQQDRDAHEFFDLRQRVFVFLVAVVLGGGRGEPGQVVQGLGTLFRQRRVGAGREPERAEEAAAPVEQRTAALAEGGIAFGKQQLEGETAIAQ